MPSFVSFIAFCYITDSPKQHRQPAYSISPPFRFGVGHRQPFRPARLTAARAFNNLTDDTKDRPTSVLFCPLYGWVAPFPPFPPVPPRPSPMERLNHHK
jgi:hypothetical protein